MGRPERHNEPTVHFELLNQRRRDVVKRSRHDHCVETTTFWPSEITVTNLDTHIVVPEFSKHPRSGFGQWRNNLDGTDLSSQTRQYCSLIT